MGKKARKHVRRLGERFRNQSSSRGTVLCRVSHQREDCLLPISFHIVSISVDPLRKERRTSACSVFAAARSAHSPSTTSHRKKRSPSSHFLVALAQRMFDRLTHIACARDPDRLDASCERACERRCNAWLAMHGCRHASAENRSALAEFFARIG